MSKQKIYSSLAPQAIGSYSQAIQSGNTIYFSGQIPLDAKSMVLVSEDFAIQTNQIFSNMQEVCKASGVSLNDIVKLTVYLTDISQAAIVNEIMKEFFQEPYPARTTIQVSALPKAAQIEIDAIAVKSN